MKSIGLVPVVLLLAITSAVTQTPVTTNILQRVNVVGVDRMTTADPSSETCTPGECPSEGQFFYVPAAEEPGTVPLYRFFNRLDHMDATTSSVPGYWMEGPLGFPWITGSLPGLRPMFEAFDSTTGDHALKFPYEKLTGYQPTPLKAFGYPRYMNQMESILSLSAGGVTVDSNRVYGGTLWRWTWNNKQFLSNTYSFQGSYSILFINGWTNQINENGDACDNHAPIIKTVNVGLTQFTLSVPLADAFAFGNDNPCIHPVVWKDAQLGKMLTLNFNGMGPVAKYTTVLSLPNGTEADFYHPISTFKGEFNRYWTYDAEAAMLQEVTIPDTCEGGHPPFSPRFGGIILSDESGKYAMGMYGVNASQGGSVTGWGLLRHVCDDGVFSRMDVVYSGEIPAGYSTYNVYLMTGTVSQVRVYMDRLFQSGVK